MRVNNRRFAVCLFGLAALATSVAGNASALTNSWVGGSSYDWEDGANWSLGVPPGPAQSVLLTNSYSSTFIDATTAATASNTMTVSDLVVGGLTGQVNVLTIYQAGTNAPVRVLNDLTVSGQGSLSMFDSALDVSGHWALNGVTVLNSNLVSVGSITVGSSPAGSYWRNGLFLLVGANVDVQGRMTIGGSVNSTGSARLVYGRLTVTNATFALGEAGVAIVTNSLAELRVRDLVVARRASAVATFVQLGGTVTANALVMTNAGGRLTFDGGWVTTAATTASNGQLFVVGNGVAPARMTLNGGVHRFDDGLKISANATLDGCGTVVGPVTNEGLLAVTCPAASMIFSDAVVNSGTIIATNSATLEFFGPVINHGTIDAVAGAANFHSTYTGNGVFVNAENAVRVVSVSAGNSEFIVSFATVPNKTYAVDRTGNLLAGPWETITNNIPGTGGVIEIHDPLASSTASRFYRVRLLVP